MAQLAQCFGFDLADAFAGYGEALADFFQSVLAAVFEAEAHFDYFFFARGQRAQDLSSLVLEVHVDHGFGWRDYGAVFDEVAEMRIFLFADWRFERDRLLRDLQNLPHFRHRNVHALGDFFRRRLASQFLHQLPRSADQLVDGFDHVHRDANRTRLISDGAGNRLPNPPRGIRGKFVATAVFEFVHGFHQADVAFLNQVEELQTAVGVFLGDGNHQAEVGLDQLALGLLRVHVALDDLALSALELLKRHAGFQFQLFHFAANGTRLAPVFFFLFFAASGVRLALEILRLAIERAHAVDHLVEAVDQPLALGVGEAQLAHRLRYANNRAGKVPARAAMVLGTLLLRSCNVLFFDDADLFVELGHGIDLAGELVQAILQNLVGDLFFVEGDHFLDRAHALFEVFAHGQQFPDDDGRPRQGLEHADLTALDALGDFHFAFAREQRHGPHLTQIHADGVVGFFQSSGGEVEFDVLGAFFSILEFFIERGGGRRLRAFQNVDSLRTNRGQQIVQVVGTVHIVRDQVIDLIVGEISLLFACVDQLLYVFVFVVKSQEVSLTQLNSLAVSVVVKFREGWDWDSAGLCLAQTYRV